MRNVLTSVTELVAAGLVVAGVALLFIPAALMVAGILLGVFSWRMAR